MGAQVHTGGAVGNTVVATAGVGRALDLCNNDSDIAVTVHRAPRVLGPARTPRLLAGVSQAGGRAGGHRHTPCGPTLPPHLPRPTSDAVSLEILWSCAHKHKGGDNGLSVPVHHPDWARVGCRPAGEERRPSWGSPFRVLVTVCHSCAQRVCVTLACSLAGVAVPIATS